MKSHASIDLDSKTFTLTVDHDVSSDELLQAGEIEIDPFVFFLTEGNIEIPYTVKLVSGTAEYELKKPPFKDPISLPGPWEYTEALDHCVLKKIS